MNAKKYLTLGIILSSSLLLSFNNDKRAQAQESALEKTGENASNRRRISTSTTINDDGSTTTYYQTSDESQVPEAVKNNPNDYNYSEKILPGETKTTADPGEIPAGSAVTEEIIEGETHYTTDHDEAKKHGNVQNVGETDADANTPNAVEVNDGAVRSGKKPDNAQGIQLPDKEVPSLSEDHLSKEEYEKKKAELEEAGYIIIDTTPSETPSYGEWSEPIDGTAPQDQLDNHTAEQLPDKVEHLTSPTPIQAGTTGAVTISNVQIRYVPADTSKSATHLGAWSEVPEGADSIAEKLAELLLTGENESQVRAQLKADGFSDESIDLIIKSAVSITVETVSTATDTEIKNAVSTALADANISLSAENLALIIGMVKTEAEKALNNTGQTIVAYILPDGTKGEVSLGDVKETEPDFLTKLEEALKDKGLTAEEITSILTPVKSFTKGSDLKITSDDLAGYGTFATLAEMQTAISDYLTAHHSYTQKEIESFLQTFSAEIKAGFNAQSQSGGTFEPGSVTTEADKAIASFLQNYAAGTLENASEIYNSKNSLLDSLLKAATEFHVFTREFNAGTQHIDGNVATENLESLSNHIGMNFLTNNTIPGVTDLFYFQNVNANGNVQIVNGGDVIVGSNSSVSGSTVNGVTFSHLKGQIIAEDAGTKYIDFEEEFKYCTALSDVIAGQSNSKGVTIEKNHNTISIDISNAEGKYAVINLEEKDLEHAIINISGLSKGADGSFTQALLINVIDSDGDSAINVKTSQVNLHYTDNTSHKQGEQKDFSPATVLWNFNQFSDVTISYGKIFGQMLAPTANVTVSNSASFDGNLIARTAQINQETHRWDFQGSYPGSSSPSFVLNYSESTSKNYAVEGNPARPSTVRVSFAVAEGYTWGTNYTYTKTAKQYRTREKETSQNYSFKVYEQSWQPIKWVVTQYSYRNDTTIYHYRKDTKLITWETTTEPDTDNADQESPSGTLPDTGESGTIPDTSNPDTTPDTGESGTPPDTSNPDTTPDTGESGTVPDTSNPDTTPDTGESGTVPDTSNPEATPDTGESGILPDTSNPGTTPDTGESGTIPDTSNPDTTPDTGESGTLPDTSNPKTPPGTGESGTVPDTSNPGTASATTPSETSQLPKTNEKKSFTLNFAGILALLTASFGILYLRRKDK